MNAHDSRIHSIAEHYTDSGSTTVINLQASHPQGWDVGRRDQICKFTAYQTFIGSGIYNQFLKSKFHVSSVPKVFGP